MKSLPAVALALFVGTEAYAAQDVRWTWHDDRDAAFAHVLEKIDAQTGLALTEADFQQAEDRDLAFAGHYRRYDQVRDGARLEGMSIRIWTKLRGATRRLVQLEAQVDNPAPAPATATVARERRARAADPAPWADDLARAAIAATDDAAVRAVTSETVWANGRLVRIVKIKARRGVHVVRIDLQDRALTRQTYEPFPHGDYQVPALVFPIYEEYGGKILPRQRVALKHLLSEVRIPDGDPFAPLRDRVYLGKKNDAVQGETADGQARGFWTFNWLHARADGLIAQIPLAPNTTNAGQAHLQGRYATINIHPEAMSAFPAIEIPKLFSTHLHFAYKEAGDDYEVIPGAAYFGKPLDSRTAALDRDATRHPTHDPAYYINRGFDEVQVYYAVNELFESLRPMGFKDPELSTRPFDAFLFDPDVENMDNAFYDSDTINFSTYSPDQLNMARDNTTIWHELGHGVMDRLMGTRLELADTGGLSEGMADFVAELVLRATNRDQPFPGQNDQRIINRTGFFLTNEVHDDGEAYGGTMKAILDAATAAHGEKKGLAMVVDLVLEAMRLARDNPHLTAQDWFDHILFADELGRKGVRAPGELAELIRGALAARNFAPEAERAGFTLSHAGKAVEAGEPGSRGHEIKLELHEGEQATYPVELTLKDGDGFKFHYPAEVKVFFNSGPLQGAIDWVGEDHEPQLLTIAGPGEPVTLPLTVNGKCDTINRGDGTCSDFAYVQIFNPGDDKPVAKKRFYLRIKTLPAAAGVE